MSNQSPDGWITSSLGEVCRFTMGQSPSSDTYNTEGEGLPFFQGKADFGSKYPKVRSWCKKPVKVANESAILFSVRAPVGEVNVTPFMACVGRGLAAIEAESADQEFIYQKLQQLKPCFALLSQGSTFEAVNGEQLRQFSVALPPLPEQQKIATILSSVDDVIEKTRAQIDKLKELKTGMMQELLTQGIGHTEFKDSPVGRIPAEWDVQKIGDLFEVQLGKMLSKASKTGQSSFPYLGNKNVQWSYIDLSDLESMDFTEGEREKFELKNGDVLICEGGDVGRAAVWRCPIRNCYYQKALHRLRPRTESLSPELLVEFMRLLKVSNFLLDYTSRTSISHLTRENLVKIPVPVPPTAEQKIIVGMLNAMNSKIEAGQRKLLKYQDNKKALMQDLLTGQVRVNVDQKESEVA